MPEAGPDAGPPAESLAAGQLKRARESLAAARAQAQARGVPRPLAPRAPTAPRSAADTDGQASPGVPAGQAGTGVPAGPGSQAGTGVPAAAPGTGRAAESPHAARRVRRDDPQALGAAIEGLLQAEGWSLAAATGSVFGRWAQIVGADLAGHTKPESLRDGELTVVADSTAWATQVRLLSAQLVHRLNTELGNGTVSRVKVLGPVSASRRPGEWRVRGSRGPRDTYG